MTSGVEIKRAGIGIVARNHSEKLGHAGAETEEHGTGNQVMTDVQFGEVGGPEQFRQIGEMDSVTGIHLESAFMALDRGRAEGFKFSIAAGSPRIY